MKLVLSGYYGFDNVGDEAILYSIISAFRELDPKIELTVLSNQPEKTAKQYGVQAVNRWKLSDIAKVIKAADGVISGGGSLLQDKTGNRSVIYYSAIMWIAKFFRKPYFIYAQGVGPVDRPFNQRIVKASLEGTALLTVRDEESAEFLRKIGVKKSIQLVPDPVLGIAVEEENGRLVEGDYFAVSVRDWPSEHNFLKEVAAGLDVFVEKGYEILFIPMHGEHDEATSEETVKLMKHHAFIAPHDGTINQKVRWIEDSHLLIGMRLHALIFAAVVDKPFVALSYDPKIDSFAQLCKQPVAAHVNEKWEAAEFVSVINRQLEHMDAAKEKLMSYTQDAKRQAKQTAANVLAILNK
ncbi:polysaccharide pyruvyl transferase CsaB [Halalkalibacter urbisdiaboli]|uniref:polysaccharide pyruvyl transferase CsaB n=1 Tax=Halalkalibacter urbisdiaboli TaxID=1960589 RepID=UPI000B45194F|nr:polysaccharide pyruvyl transferase CsaB [Halalkalibacter urbisdiaboli]